MGSYDPLFQHYRSLPNADRANYLATIPLPPDSRFEAKIPLSEQYDQDRVHLSVTDACRYKRIFGLVAALRLESRSAGTRTPASFQVVTKVCWWSTVNARWEHGYFRTTAFSAAFTPQGGGWLGHSRCLRDAYRRDFGTPSL